LERIHVDPPPECPSCLPAFAFVDPETFQPVEIHGRGGIALPGAPPVPLRQVDRYLTFEYLPRTAANLALTDIRAQHPDAVPGAASTSASGSRLAVDSSTSGALQGRVRIVLRGTRRPVSGEANGRFTMSGAISDRGRFVDRRPGLTTYRTLLGAKGKIFIQAGLSSPEPLCQCVWRITNGTRAYAGLRGRGRQGGRSTDRINITMTGTVSR
jgi:hypothetical protein